MDHQHLRCQGRAFNNYVDNKRREGAAESPQGVSRLSTGDKVTMFVHLSGGEGVKIG